MSTEKTPQQQDYESRIYDEMLDGFDEELEMEIDDDRMNALIADVVNSEVEGSGLSRSFYFKEIFRLQGELVKLQDWVVHKKLKVVEASKYKDIDLLKDGDEDNPHVWMSVTYSIGQVKAITASLCEADPAHADAYRKNALDYCMKLEALKKEMHEQLDNLPHKDIVTFHEAFPYLAKEFKLNVVSVIEREPGTEPTPQELEATIAKVNSLPVKVLFTEPQYSPAAAETIARETGAKIYTLDPVVTGEADEQAMDAYINAMKKNMEVLKEALQ